MNEFSEVARDAPQQVTARVKWFDRARGFGFLTGPVDGDIMLTAEVARSSGVESLFENDEVEVTIMRGERGWFTRHILRHRSSQPIRPPRPTDLLAELPVSSDWLPAKVKWFDKAKGFGFVNLWGREGDVFLHMEVVRQAGLIEVTAGQGLAVKIGEGPRGLIAVSCQSWLEG